MLRQQHLREQRRPGIGLQTRSVLRQARAILHLQPLREQIRGQMLRQPQNPVQFRDLLQQRRQIVQLREFRDLLQQMRPMVQLRELRDLLQQMRQMAQLRVPVDQMRQLRQLQDLEMLQLREQMRQPVLGRSLG